MALAGFIAAMQGLVNFQILNLGISQTTNRGGHGLPSVPDTEWVGRRFLNDRLDWNLLRTYLVIGQEGSMSRAAARLHITQSAVSQALKRLEEQLDCVLIVRGAGALN